METLAQNIGAVLALQPSCMVYNNELARMFPDLSNAAQARFAAITAFAEAQGLSVRIHDPGIRCTFRKL